MKLKELMEQSIEDCYKFGMLDDEEYEDAVIDINTPYQVQRLERFLTREVHDRWVKIIGDFQDGILDSEEYAITLHDIMCDFEEDVVIQIEDSYNRAMRGI